MASDKSEAQVGAELAKEIAATARLVDLPATPGVPPGQVLLGPNGISARSVKALIDEYRTAPERREGTAAFEDLSSFIAHAIRFADADSAVFCESADYVAKLTSVLDYHRATADGAPRYGTHRGVYAFPFSDEWKAWKGLQGRTMDQATFARVLEDRVMDVCDPSTAGPGAIALAAQLGVSFASPSKLLGLSRGIEISVDKKIAQVVKLQSGEARISFEETHTDKDGSPMTVPGAFLLLVPVFQGDAPYQIPARLRYKVSGGALSWTVELYRLDMAFRDALSKCCDRVSAETKLPLFRGTPETADE